MTDYSARVILTDGFSGTLGKLAAGSAKGKAALEQMAAGGGSALSVLGSVLGGALGPTAIVGTAAALLNLSGDLGDLGAQAITTERSFASVLASVGAAPDLFDRLDTAAAGTIEDLRLMQLANTALAGASDELGAAFANALPKLIEGARAANMLNPALGDTEFLFQSLVTGIKRGSPMLIDNTGITLKLGEANERYAAQLGKAADALTEEEQKLALLQATTEGVDRLVQQAGGNLESLTTNAQRLTAAWSDLRAEIGKKLAPEVSGVEGVIASLLSDLTGALSGTNEKLMLELDVTNAEAELARVSEGLRLAAENGTHAGRSTQFWTSEVARAGAELVAAKVAMGQYADVQGDMNERLRAGVPIEADMAERLRETAGAAREAAVATEELNAARTTGTFTTPSKTRWGLYADYARNFQEAGALSIEQWETQHERANEKVANDYRSAMDSAAQDAVNRIEGYLGTAMSNAAGLLDMGGGPGDNMAPGANGPFENIYRALDVAKLGDKSPWAAMLGLTQEEAQKISTDFQNGLFSAGVLNLIDMDALANQARMAELAEQSQTAFAAAIAAKAGTGPNLVATMLGLDTGAGTGGGGMASKVTGTGAQILTTLSAELDAGKPTLLAAFESLGGEAARATLGAAKKGFGAIREELATIISPYVWQYIQANYGGALP